MPKELNMIQPPGLGNGEACTFLWACAVCDETEWCKKDKEGHNRWLVAKRMERVEHIVLVMSHRGGVGNSTVTTNLAVSLALKGRHVGICELDIHGPTIQKMVGVEGQQLKVSTSGGIIPIQAYSLRIASMSSFLLPHSDDPILRRDGDKYACIDQLLGGVEWQDLNFLLVDLPAGTGHESGRTIDLLGHVTGAVIVTTPEEAARLDARKSVGFCRDRAVPIIGLVENMSGLDRPQCGHPIDMFRTGGGEASVVELGVPFLGHIPLNPDVVTQSDAGEPFALFNSDTAAASVFHDVANKVEAFCKKSASLIRRPSLMKR